MGFSTLLRHATTKPCALPSLPASSQFQVDPEGRNLPARRRAMTPRSHCSLNEFYFLSQTRKSYLFSSVPEIQRAIRNSCSWYFVFTRQYISHAYKCIACAWLFSTIPDGAAKVFSGRGSQDMCSFLFALRTILGRTFGTVFSDLSEGIGIVDMQRERCWKPSQFLQRAIQIQGLFRNLLKQIRRSFLTDSVGGIFKWKQRILRFLFHEVFKWLLTDPSLTSSPLILTLLFSVLRYQVD